MVSPESSSTENTYSLIKIKHLQQFPSERITITCDLHSFVQEKLCLHWEKLYHSTQSGFNVRPVSQDTSCKPVEVCFFLTKSCDGGPSLESKLVLALILSIEIVEFLKNFNYICCFNLDRWNFKCKEIKLFSFDEL